LQSAGYNFPLNLSPTALAANCLRKEPDNVCFRFPKGFSDKSCSSSASGKTDAGFLDELFHEIEKESTACSACSGQWEWGSLITRNQCLLILETSTILQTLGLKRSIFRNISRHRKREQENESKNINRVAKFAESASRLDLRLSKKKPMRSFREREKDSIPSIARNFVWLRNGENIKINKWEKDPVELDVFAAASQARTARVEKDWTRTQANYAWRLISAQFTWMTVLPWAHNYGTSYPISQFFLIHDQGHILCFVF
jgi:hypothetical protein